MLQTGGIIRSRGIVTLRTIFLRRIQKCRIGTGTLGMHPVKSL